MKHKKEKKEKKHKKERKQKYLRVAENLRFENGDVYGEYEPGNTNALISSGSKRKRRQDSDEVDSKHPKSKRTKDRQSTFQVESPCCDSGTVGRNMLGGCTSTIDSFGNLLPSDEDSVSDDTEKERGFACELQSKIRPLTHDVTLLTTAPNQILLATFPQASMGILKRLEFGLFCRNSRQDRPERVLYADAKAVEFEAHNFGTNNEANEKLDRYLVFH